MLGYLVEAISGVEEFAEERKLEVRCWRLEEKQQPQRRERIEVGARCATRVGKPTSGVAGGLVRPSPTTAKATATADARTKKPNAKPGRW